MAEDAKKDDIKTPETEAVKAEDQAAPEKEEVKKEVSKEETPKVETTEEKKDDAPKEEISEGVKEEKVEEKNEEKTEKEKEQEKKIGGSKWAKRQQNKRGKGKGRGRRDRPAEQKEFDEVVLKIDRVSRMMKGGRRMSFRASVVIGDRKGRVGFGMGKAGEVQGAIQKAVREARKALINVPLKDERTIPHRIDHKFKAARIRIMPASEGTGVIAGGTIRAILELGGMKDCLSKNIGTNNKVTIAKATIEALQMMEGKGGRSKKKEDEKKTEKKEEEGEKKVEKK